MQLKKEIGLFGGIAVIAGIMIGSGIFVFGSLILTRVGFALGLSLVVWLVGGLITLFSGLTYAELGTMFPETGGYYVYLRKAYGKKTAFLSGTMNFVLASSGSIALLALVFSDILSYVLPISAYVKWIAAGLIIILSGINYLGVKFGSLVQKIFLIAKLIPLISIIFIGLFLGTETVTLNFIPQSGLSGIKIFTTIGFGIVGTLWAYEGWTNLNSISGEMKNVKKDLPKAIIFAITGVTIIYVLFTFAIYRLIPLNDLINLSQDGAVLPIPAMMSIFGNTGMTLVFIAVMVSVFGALNGSIMVFPRVYYAMALDQTFFKSFKTIDKKRQTPSVAIFGSMVMSLILLLFNVEQLLTFVVLTGLIFNTLIFISVFIFRKKEPDLNRPYKTWGYPYVPILAIVGMIGLFVATIIEDFIPSLIGLGVLGLAFVFYTFVIEKRSNRNS
ncbi:MAG: amino acid permease [Acholeplasmataceae bacterium]|nr:amino acid permease [Acholeplasmataceae bacterium]